MLAVQMPPTVCSEKKVHLAVMKESRRRASMGVSRSSTSTGTGTGAEAGAAQNSIVLSYGEYISLLTHMSYT